MPNNAKKLQDRTRIPVQLTRQNRLPLPHTQASTMKLRTRCYLLLALAVPLCKREWGVPLNVGRLVPVTTSGEKAQITELDTSKFGTLQNQTTGMELQGLSSPCVVPDVLFFKRPIPRKLGGGPHQHLIMVALLLQTQVIQR